MLNRSCSRHIIGPHIFNFVSVIMMPLRRESGMINDRFHSDTSAFDHITRVADTNRTPTQPPLPLLLLLQH